MFIFQFLTNLVVLIPLLATTCVGAGLAIGIIGSTPRKNQALKLDIKTGRGVLYDVDKEGAIDISCKPVGDTPPQKFIHGGRHAFNVVRKGLFKLQHYALWIGRYGTAYVYRFDSKDSQEAKISLKEGIMEVLTPQLYNQLSDDIQHKIEVAEMGIIIDLPSEPLTPAGLPSINSDDIKRDSDDKVLKSIAQHIHEQAKVGFSWNLLLGIGCGVGIGFVAAWFLKVGGTTIQQPSSTTHAILSFLGLF
jgi:hypothetical protein